MLYEGLSKSSNFGTKNAVLILILMEYALWEESGDNGFSLNFLS